MFAQQGVYQLPSGLNESGGPVVWDLRYSSSGNSSWWIQSVTMLGCGHWQPPNDVLFQLACVLLAAGLLAFDTPYGALLLHSLFFLGYLLMSVWSWVILCAPDFFSWNFAFLLLNGVQTMSLIYSIRPVRFCQELEEVYTAIFLPLRVPRSLYKRLVGAEYCTLMTLNEGEHYATQSLTKTDKLGLLISGTMNAYSNRTLLHTIKAKQFIDSPEFESSNSGEEKFQVSIVAGSLCRYLFWPRQSLEYLLVQEPYLANVLNMVLGRDITNKLYALNERVCTVEGSRLDIRLPSVSPNLRARRDIRKAVVGVASPGKEGREGEGTPPPAAATAPIRAPFPAPLAAPTSPASEDDSDDENDEYFWVSEVHLNTLDTCRSPVLQTDRYTRALYLCPYLAGTHVSLDP
ncbi:popeye domain-containing protein 3-like isoform X2 [Babylonia areolata]|uniref:popeye domain-containing protein 3-like isoform X2 n=1 Tax=Babylonia areolata TaxID=304850 RepID=UPI003FD5D047